MNKYNHELIQPVEYRDVGTHPNLIPLRYIFLDGLKYSLNLTVHEIEFVGLFIAVRFAEKKSI